MQGELGFYPDRPLRADAILSGHGKPSKSRKMSIAESRKAPPGATRRNVLGRDARPAVEDPVMTSASSRETAQDSLSFLLRVRTNYRSVAGARRQLVATQRISLPIQNVQLLGAPNNIRNLPKRAPTAPSTNPPAPKAKAA